MDYETYAAAGLSNALVVEGAFGHLALSTLVLLGVAMPLVTDRMEITGARRR